jgi:tight adherence protein B
MSSTLSFPTLAHAGLALLGAAIFVCVHDLLHSAESRRHPWWLRYERALDRELEFLLSTRSSSTITRPQVITCVLLIALACTTGTAQWLVLLPAAVIGPWMVLKQLRARRITRLESQLDGWLVTLANALKASPSLADAIASTATLMHAPMSQELDLLVKHQHLGTPLDEALHNMGVRIGSRTIATALVTLLIARQSGGDVPATLETSAATLREMTRLEGVIRTKTAEGKSQALVLACVPAFLLMSIHHVHPTLLQPLFESLLGHALLALALALWLGAIPISLKILNVDI